ncbi:MAG: type II secretion system GspH family protein [Oscillospiraceae bacterium]|jgi:prepilin-type N-terminal cleavage/methylation domain-containing protein|nr:type II secretion system GspH family protein [Oscillospiraceae bacterium]
MKNKKLKAFTLIELIIVMAIFSLIMGGALMLINPVKSLFNNTSEYTESNASLDNVAHYLETTLNAANRMHIYVGWENFSDIGVNNADPLFNTSKWDFGGYDDKEWGKPLPVDISTVNKPVDYFARYFHLTDDMVLRKNITVNNGFVLDWAQQNGHTTATGAVGNWFRDYTISRTELDSSLQSDKYNVYVLSILHDNNAGSEYMIKKPNVNPGYTTPNPELGGLTLSQYKTDGTLVKVQDAINKVYYDKYDFKLVFGEIGIDASGKRILATDHPSTPTVDETENIYQYRGYVDSAGVIVSEGNFYDVSRFTATVIGKPTGASTTFAGFGKVYSAAMGLENVNGLKEEVYFNVKTSKLQLDPVTGITVVAPGGSGGSTTTSGVIPPSTSDVTITGSTSPVPFYSIDPSLFKTDPPNALSSLLFPTISPDPVDYPLGSNIDYNNYPVYYTEGGAVKTQDVGSSQTPLYIKKNYDHRLVDFSGTTEKRDELNRLGVPQYGTVAVAPERFKLFLNSTSPQATYDQAANKNVFIVFTLPKDFYLF